MGNAEGGDCRPTLGQPVLPLSPLCSLFLGLSLPCPQLCVQRPCKLLLLPHFFTLSPSIVAISLRVSVLFSHLFLASVSLSHSSHSLLFVCLLLSPRPYPRNSQVREWT